MTKEQYDNPKTRRRILKRLHAEAARTTTSEPIINLGKLIKEKRAGKKLTLEQLEKLTGIGFSYLIRLEKGRTNPTVKTLEKLALALGLELRIDLVRPKQQSDYAEDNSL